MQLEAQHASSKVANVPTQLEPTLPLTESLTRWKMHLLAWRVVPDST